jgi:hypothetical protein
MTLLVTACPGEKGTSTTVRFRVEPVGGATVTLWDSGKGFHEQVKAADVVELEAPRDKLHEPRVTVESADGAETMSPKLSVSPITTTVSVGKLRIWPAKVGVQRDGSRFRFSWPALEGPDVPEDLRYSLLFVYKNAAGDPLEGSLIDKEKRCEAVPTLAILSEIFPDRDPAVKTMTLRIRAYAGSGPESTLWAGPKQEWAVPEDLPIPPPEKK